MYAHYADIISRIDSDPIWFDEHAVPRYCEFEPRHSASIHVQEIALAEISCQACRRLFRVAFSAVNFTPKDTEQQSEPQHSDEKSEPENFRPIADAIQAKTLHFGDPPNVRCCAAGNSMNSVPRRVIEYWARGDRKYVSGRNITDPRYFDWVRDTSLEIDIMPDWAR